MIAVDSITMGLIIFVVALLVVYDVWTIIKRGSDTTISVQLFEYSKRYPIIAFLLGVVFGHIFWPLQ